ncbi:MAG: hypothetical protein AAFY76_20520, partial [Cyanobacteria bacterium J06649_11]
TQTSNGNAEVQGLGNHKSWVDTKILADDPRALCSDTGLGNNIRTSSTRIAQSTSQSSRSSSASASKAGGGGGIKVFGIGGANGGGGKQNSQRKNQSNSSRSNRTQQSSSGSSTVVQGRNCDAFVESAAAREKLQKMVLFGVELVVASQVF